MTVNSSSVAQIATIPSSSSCYCGRCGDVIATCRLEPRPSSCDPVSQQVSSDWATHQAGYELARRSVGIDLGDSRRMSEKRLNEYWESIALSEPVQEIWLPSLPEWVVDDAVLLKIAGVNRIPGETDSQRLDRLRKEYKEREKLHPWPSPGSPSNFTDSEDDSPCNPPGLPEGRNADARAGQQILMPDVIKRTSNDTISPCSSSSHSQGPANGPYNSPVYFIIERAERQKRELRALGRLGTPRKGLSDQADSSRLSSPPPGSLSQSNTINTGPADSSRIPHSGLSSQVTQTSVPELTELGEKAELSFTTTYTITINESAYKLASHVHPNSRSTTSLAPDPSSQSLMTPSSSPRKEEQPYYPGVVRVKGGESENDTESQDYRSGLLGTSLVYVELTARNSRKRKQARSNLPPLDFIPSPTGNDDNQSMRSRKRVRTRHKS